MNIFIILEALVLLLCAGGAVVCLVLLLVGCCFRKSWAKALRIFSAMGLLAFVFAGVGVGGCSAWMWSPTKNPERVFKSAFGKAPPGGVTDIRGEAGGIADSGWIDVKFKADEQTFRQLLPADLKQITLKEWDRQAGRFNPPEWWSPVADDGTQVFFRGTEFGTMDRKPGPRGFYSEANVMTWNPNTHVVQFLWSGID